MNEPAIILDRSVGANGLLTGGVIRTDLGWFASPADAAVVVASLKGPAKNMMVVRLGSEAKLDTAMVLPDRPLYVILREAPLSIESAARSNSVTYWSSVEELAIDRASKMNRTEYQHYVSLTHQANEGAIRDYANKLLRAVNSGNGIATGTLAFPEPPKLRVAIEDDQWWAGEPDSREFQRFSVVTLAPHEKA